MSLNIPSVTSGKRIKGYLSALVFLTASFNSPIVVFRIRTSYRRAWRTRKKKLGSLRNRISLRLIGANFVAIRVLTKKRRVRGRGLVGTRIGPARLAI